MPAVVPNKVIHSDPVLKSITPPHRPPNPVIHSDPVSNPIAPHCLPLVQEEPSVHTFPVQPQSFSPSRLASISAVHTNVTCEVVAATSVPTSIAFGHNTHKYIKSAKNLNIKVLPQINIYCLWFGDGHILLLLSNKTSTTIPYVFNWGCC